MDSDDTSTWSSTRAIHASSSSVAASPFAGFASPFDASPFAGCTVAVAVAVAVARSVGFSSVMPVNWFDSRSAIFRAQIEEDTAGGGV
jgi:hypothetical protein